MMNLVAANVRWCVDIDGCVPHAEEMWYVTLDLTNSGRVHRVFPLLYKLA